MAAKSSQSTQMDWLTRKYKIRYERVNFFNFYSVLSISGYFTSLTLYGWLARVSLTTLASGPR